MDIFIARVGLFLMAAGTLSTYIAFTITRGFADYGTLPVITDMFREWPLAASSTTGLGCTLLLYGLPGTRKPWMLLATCSLWLVVGSSNSFGMAFLAWFHTIATLAFLFFSVAELRKISHHYVTLWAQAAGVASAVSVVACGLALSTDSQLPGAKMALGISEISFLLALSLGFVEELFFSQVETEKNIVNSIFKL